MSDDPNKSQVGGSHYRSEYQHWDWVIDIQLGYLESAATKYLTRWKEKNGLQDIRKSIHYIEKLISSYDEKGYRRTYWDMIGAAEIKGLTNRFAEKNNLDPDEKNIFFEIAMWENEYDLKRIHKKITDYLEAQQAAINAGRTNAPQKGKTTASGPHMGGNGQTQGKVNHPAPFGYQDEKN